MIQPVKQEAHLKVSPEDTEEIRTTVRSPRIWTLFALVLLAVGVIFVSGLMWLRSQTGRKVGIAAPASVPVLVARAPASAGSGLRTA